MECCSLPTGALNISRLGELKTSSGSTFHCTITRGKMNTYINPLPCAIGKTSWNGRVWLNEGLTGYSQGGILRPCCWQSGKWGKDVHLLCWRVRQPKVSSIADTLTLLSKLQVVQRAARRWTFSVWLVLSLWWGSHMAAAYSSWDQTMVFICTSLCSMTIRD